MVWEGEKSIWKQTLLSQVLIWGHSEEMVFPWVRVVKQRKTVTRRDLESHEDIKFNIKRNNNYYFLYLSYCKFSCSFCFQNASINLVISELCRGWWNLVSARVCSTCISTLEIHVHVYYYSTLKIHIHLPCIQCSNIYMFSLFTWTWASNWKCDLYLWYWMYWLNHKILLYAVKVQICVLNHIDINEMTISSTNFHC